MSSLAQRTFAGGEIAPSLWGRTDQSKYATGLRTCRNCIVQRHGGVANRAGTQLAGETKNSGAARLLPFVYSPDPDQVYVLEFGHRYMRVYQDGGQVVVSGVGAWATATNYAVGQLVARGGIHYYAKVAHTSGSSTEPATGADWPATWHALTGSIYEMPTPYTTAQLRDLRFVQSGDVVTIVHPSHAPRNLARTGHTTWTLTAIDFGATIQAPTGLALGGGAAGTNTYHYKVTAVDVRGNESAAAVASIASMADLAGLASSPITLTWNPVANAVAYNIYRSTDGVTYGLISLAGGSSSASSAAGWSTAVSTISTASTGSDVLSGTPAAIELFATAAAEKAPSGEYTMRGTLVLGIANYHLGDSGSAKVYAYYKRGAEAPVLYGVIAEVTTPGTHALTETVIVPDNGYDTLELQFYAAVQGDAPGTGTFEATFTGTDVRWNRGASGIGDAGAAADMTIAPPTQTASFNAAGRYPSVVGYYQQRRLFGASNNEPETVWASRTGDYANFGMSSPLQDDDAVTFSLVGNQVNEVQWLLELERLIVGTTSGIHRVDGGEDGVFTPAAISPHKISYNGSANLAPIPVNTALLYVQARGAFPRDLRVDATDGQGDRDLSIYASHLFDGYTLVAWAHQAIPHSIVWAVRSDGTLLGLTYIREHEVYGWHRHDTLGLVEDVVAVPEGNEDRVYLVVARTVAGQTRRYVERMGSRTITALTDVRDLIFMDSALTYDGRNTGTEEVWLTSGIAWDDATSFTVNRSVGGFAPGDIGKVLVFADARGVTLLRVTLTDYVSGTVMIGSPDRIVPADLRGFATTRWGIASATFTGLAHLEGQSLAVVGDGEIVASPNNVVDYPDAVVVSGGQITLDRPYAVVHAGLPYLADLETLDIDTASGPSVKGGAVNPTLVNVFVEKSTSFWAGGAPPSSDATDPLEALDEARLRDEDDTPNALVLATDTATVGLQSEWNSHGRIFLRQPDPAPLTVLAINTGGHLPAAR